MPARRIKFSALFVVLSAGALAAVLRAEIPPEDFQGYFATDRWGRHVFHAGSAHVFVSDQAAEQLKERAGRPVRLEKPELDFEGREDDFILKTAGKVVPLDADPPLTLSAEAEATEVKHGAGLKLRVTIRNETDQTPEVQPKLFEVVLLTRDPSGQTPPDYEDPDGRAYWFRRSVGGGPDPQAVEWIGARDVPLGIDDYAMIGRGEGFRRAGGSGGEPTTLTAAPGASFEADVTVGAELPPGEYEAFVTYGEGKWDGPAAPASRRIAFDVLDADGGDGGAPRTAE